MKISFITKTNFSIRLMNIEVFIENEIMFFKEIFQKKNLYI